MTSPEIPVRGVELDSATRCRHYHGPSDIIAIRMRCCGSYYACIDCHFELVGHPAAVWPRDEWQTPAVLCGLCKAELSVREYMDCGSTCPRCRAAFNPGCRNHYHLYFEMEPESSR
jgi:uncharacterized CHY-type Zn-finger protein